MTEVKKSKRISTAVNVENKEKTMVTSQKVEEQPKRINPEDYIDVISLCPYEITLTTERKGRGTAYTFIGFGDLSPVIYSDLQLLLKNHGNNVTTNFFRDGYIYINDPLVVKRVGLQKVYEKILNPEEMATAIACNSNKAVELFERTTIAQRKLICESIVLNLIKQERGDESVEEKIDLNIADRLSRIVGGDYSLVQKAKSDAQYIDSRLG